MEENEIRTAGLCPVCRHVRRVDSGRGSKFYLCRRSAEDPAYPKYPPIPVMYCRGFEPAAGTERDGSST
jgi:hypothetical protein